MSNNRIYTVASLKGGVGKSTIAYEIAQLLGAVLVDFEWDGGGVSTTWGYDPLTRVTDALMSALDHSRVPRPLKGRGVKPDLVPSSPDLPEANLDAEEFGRRVASWARAWDRDVVVDTHPGASPSANGAMSQSHIVIVPAPLRTKDLAATERMVRDMLDYPLVLVPNIVRRFAPAAEVSRLERIVDGTRVQVAPFIPDGGRAVETRKKRMAMCADNPPAKALQPVVDQFHQLAKFLKEYRND